MIYDSAITNKIVQELLESPADPVCIAAGLSPKSILNIRQ